MKSAIFKIKLMSSVIPPSIVIALIALLVHADKATRFKLFLNISVILTQGDAMKRMLSCATRKLLQCGIGPFLTEREMLME